MSIAILIKIALFFILCPGSHTEIRLHGITFSTLDPTKISKSRNYLLNSLLNWGQNCLFFLIILYVFAFSVPMSQRE